MRPRIPAGSHIIFCGILAGSGDRRVLLVLEGATEMLQFRALLDEFGIARPHQVRLDKQDASSDSSSQLARFVAPRLGRIRARHIDLESIPTALFVAMDAEGRYWRTLALQEKRDLIASDTTCACRSRRGSAAREGDTDNRTDSSPTLG